MWYTTMSIPNKYKNSERRRGHLVGLEENYNAGTCNELNVQESTMQERKSSETGKIIDTLPAMYINGIMR